MIPGGEVASAKGQPGLVRAALFALCPACGASGLFAAPAAFVPRCRGCGLDLHAHEASGRLLYPLIVPIVALFVLAALRLDDALRPPLWVHAVIWPPVIALSVIGALRLGKVAMLMRKLPNPPRDGEGDHVQHGGGACPNAMNPIDAPPGRETPPPRCARSPSPFRGGSD